MDIIKVIAGIIKDNDKILITRRGPEEKFAGGWEFPGGKIEINETHEDCLVREIKEELNVLVKVDEFCEEVTYDYGSMKVNLNTYFCTILDGEIQMTVHDKYRWVETSDLLKYELLDADIPVAKKIMDFY